VTTDLFAVASESMRAQLEAAVPPACHRGIDSALEVGRDGPDVVVTSPVWTPRPGAVHLLPAFTAVQASEHTLRFELSVLLDGMWSAWAGTIGVGRTTFAPVPARVPAGRSGGELMADVDVWECSLPVDAVRLRVRLRGIEREQLARMPWALTLSAWNRRPPSTCDPAPGGVVLEVPPRSQHEEGGTIGHRICSPTSVAMVLEYCGRRVGVEDLAASMFQPSVDLYGVWPAAIQAAARHGVAGYLLRFPDWAAATWCLRRQIPIIASVRYRADELTGAAVAETSGHLLVLTGWEGRDVLVNDPAASSTRDVRRRYPLDEICRVWLGRTGVGYVLFDAMRREVPAAPGARSTTGG
jgi:Peptidase_C39 like family